MRRKPTRGNEMDGNPAGHQPPGHRSEPASVPDPARTQPIPAGSGCRAPLPGARTPAGGSGLDKQGVTGAIAAGPGRMLGDETEHCSPGVPPAAGCPAPPPAPRRDCHSPARGLLCPEAEAPWDLAPDAPCHRCLCRSLCPGCHSPPLSLTKATSLPGPSASPTGLKPLSPRH